MFHGHHDNWIEEILREMDAEEPSDEEISAEQLELLIARFNRIAGDHVRNHRYRRRSNVGGAGFRRNQRRGEAL